MTAGIVYAIVMTTMIRVLGAGRCFFPAEFCVNETRLKNSRMRGQGNDCVEFLIIMINMVGKVDVGDSI